MGYRDASESLRAYRTRILGDLEHARRAAREAADLASRVVVLEKELIETEGLLEKMGAKRAGLPMLDDVSIAAPCQASWEHMAGDEHVRFCGQCEKNVYNLSSLAREEAEALLVAREGQMCVRLFRRDDGTVLTSDCPVGVKKRRRHRAALAAVGGGLMAAAAALGLESSGPRVTMGAVQLTSVVPPVTPASAVPPVTTGSMTPTMGGLRPTTTTTSVPHQGQWTGGAVAMPPQRLRPVMGVRAIPQTVPPPSPGPSRG